MNTLRTTSSFILAAAIAGTVLSLPAGAQETPTRGPLPFSAYDQNSDGLISAEEFKVVRERRQAEGRPMRNAPSFAELDSNHDGKLTSDEFAARQNGPRGRGQGAGAGAGAGAGPGAMPAFADFDLNKDGKITEEEFTEARTARISKRAQEGYQMRGLANAPAFAEMDGNHDGALSPQEFSRALNQHQQSMGR
jgi:Ca2+-binding EF-hand superfamily protein